MPEFDKEPIKIKARKLMIDVYCRHSGRSALPVDRQFWSLCSVQSGRPTSEINQLVRLGLITKKQYYGVDWDNRKISMNEKKHSEAHWFSGDWDRVIKKEHKIFSPGIVFLDLTSLATTPLVFQATKRALRRSPPDTYLFVNVMLNNPRDPKILRTIQDFPCLLAKSITPEDFRGWQYIMYDKRLEGFPIKNAVPGNVLYLQYSCTGLTTMVLYPLWKGNQNGL